MSGISFRALQRLNPATTRIICEVYYQLDEICELIDVEQAKNELYDRMIERMRLEVERYDNLKNESE